MTDLSGAVAAARVLLVDLNNFSRYPTIPIGYLAAICRGAGMDVSVFSPLMIGVKGVVREKPVHRWSLTAAKLGYLTAVSTSPFVQRLRARAARGFKGSQVNEHHTAIVEAFKRSLQQHKPSVVLVSAYLMYRDLVALLCAACKQAGIPVLVGGPYFSQPDLIKDWLAIDGLTALAAGELELQAPEIIRSFLAGQRASHIPGIHVREADGSTRGSLAPPLKDLDRVPFPDYRDFPWDRYPNRIIPIVTGRGCAWGACTFCSDITSTAGRTFRSRSPQNVLDEICRHHETHGAKLFVFVDLKLNGNQAVWEAILGNMQACAPGSRWIAAVHVPAHHGGDGLSPDQLLQAAASGCVRLTTGLESGSQRMLDLMNKGTTVERLAEYLRNASAARISTRCTMITGYPGEQAADLDASSAFLREHVRNIERVSLNRLAMILGTGLQKMYARNPRDFPELRDVKQDVHLPLFHHRNSQSSDSAYRKSMMKLLEAVHAINRKELLEHARDFDGVM